MKLRSLQYPAACLLILMASSGARADEVLTLANAIDRARGHHPTVDAQRAQVDIESSRVEQAFAGVTPGLTGGFGYAPQTANYATTPAIARELAATSGSDTVVDRGGQAVVVSCRTPGQGNCTPVGAPPNSAKLYNYWELDLGVTWTLWDWGKSIYGIKSARTQERSAEVGVKTAQRDVVLNVALAYFGAVAAQEQLTVANETVESYRKHLDQIAAFHNSGLRTGIDVATAEAALANAQLQLAHTNANLRVAQSQLMAAMGDEQWQDWRVQPAREMFVPNDRDRQGVRPENEFVDAGLAHRTELRELDLQALSYAQQAKSARGQYLPQLALTAGPTWAGGSLTQLVPNIEAMVSLSYPLTGMNPFAVHGQTRQAAAQRAQIAAQQRGERLSVKQEVITARALLVAGLDEVKAAQTLLAAAAKQRGLAEGRYGEGVGSVIELYDALLVDASARSQAVQAGYDFATAKARVAHAVGDDY